jgi:hypothetical protein
MGVKSVGVAAVKTALPTDEEIVSNGVTQTITQMPQNHYSKPRRAWQMRFFVEKAVLNLVTHAPW